MVLLSMGHCFLFFGGVHQVTCAVDPTSLNPFRKIFVLVYSFSTNLLILAFSRFSLDFAYTCLQIQLLQLHHCWLFADFEDPGAILDALPEDALNDQELELRQAATWPA